MEDRKYIIGIDEAGRGPLAGPVCVGFVMAPKDFDFGIFPHLDDSKKMTEKRREVVIDLLDDTEIGIKTHHVFADAKSIDEEGINESIQRCIDAGLQYLQVDQQTKIWLDGGLQAPDEFLQESVTGGDAKVPAISLSSVIAKVARDQHMRKLDQQYPAYELARHKGYGTAKHRAIIEKHGLSPVHRRSYVTGLSYPEKGN